MNEIRISFIWAWEIAAIWRDAHNFLMGRCGHCIETGLYIPYNDNEWSLRSNGTLIIIEWKMEDLVIIAFLIGL